MRTLQSWRICKEEIDHVRAEADRLSPEKAPDREEMVAQWAKLEVLSPLDGTVIERNVALGDLVDTNIDLFKIADLSRLRVVAHAYEEDLPSLDALKADRRAWSVAIGSGPDAATRQGRFDRVGCIIDPNQHTALVMGWVGIVDPAHHQRRVLVGIDDAANPVEPPRAWSPASGPDPMATSPTGAVVGFQGVQRGQVFLVGMRHHASAARDRQS